MQRIDVAWRLLGCVLLLLLWEIAARNGNGLVLPSLRDTCFAVLRFAAKPDFWRDDMGASVWRVVCGFFIGAALGGGLGLCAGLWRPVRQMLIPIRWMLSCVPGVVVVMLGMLWFGLDAAMVIFAVVLTVMPTIYIGVQEGVLAIDPHLREMARIYAFTPWRQFLHLFFPGIAPSLLASSVVALGGAMRVTILAETLGASQGLGHALALARANLETAELYALALLSMLAVGVAEALLLSLVKRSTTPGRAL